MLADQIHENTKNNLVLHSVVLQNFSISQFLREIKVGESM